jgi:molecular chaperone HtpG
VFRRKGVEVLLMYDRVDEWVVSHLTEFEGKSLQSVAKGRLDLGKLEDETEKKEQEKEADEFKELIEKMKKALGESVKDVRVTLRLTDSPACLVADEQDLSANLQRLLRAAGQKAPASRPILEVNPHHRLLERLKGEGDEARFKDLSQVLYDQALLAEGGTLEDPAGFVRRVNQLLLEMAAKNP